MCVRVYLFVVISVNLYFYFQFQVFDLENAYQGKCVDYITISSSELTGPDKSPVTPLRQLCGHYEDEDLKKLSFISDENFFLINFRSDNKLSGSGFFAVFYAVDKTGQPDGMATKI